MNISEYLPDILILFDLGAQHITSNVIVKGSNLACKGHRSSISFRILEKIYVIELAKLCASEARAARRARREVGRDERSGETGKTTDDKRQRTKETIANCGFRISDFKKREDKDSTVGAAFKPRSCDFN